MAAGAAATVCISALQPTFAFQVAQQAAKEPLCPFRGLGGASAVLAREEVEEGRRHCSDTAGTYGGRQAVAGIPERQRMIWGQRLPPR